MTETEKRRPGRPRTVGRAQLNLNLGVELIARLRKQAEETGIPMSVRIRRILEDALGEEGEKGDE